MTGIDDLIREVLEQHDPDTASDDELEELAAILADLEAYQSAAGVYERFFNTETTRQDYPKHWQFFDAGKTYRQRLFRAANRVGKALHNSEIVYTETGTKPIGDLTEGDRIYGPDGLLTEVLGVYPQGLRDLYSVKFEDGVEILADIDHLWEVKQSTGRVKDYLKHGITQVVSTRDLITALERGVKYSIPQTQPVQFPERKDYLSDRYLIGALLGDGGITDNGFGITSNDQEIINRFQGCALRHKPGSYDYAIRVSFSDTAALIKKELKQLGLWNTRCHEKFIPKELLVDSVENRLELLRGLLDTDGYVTDTGKVEFSSCSERLSRGVADLARSLGYRCSISESRPKTYTYQGVKKTGRTAWTVRIVGENRSQLFSLSRKQERCNDRNRSQRRVIVSITPAGSGPATCIRVDNSTHTFLTTDFTVTHNTTAAGAELVYHLTGEYPEQWAGRQFDSATAWWVCGKSSETVRQILQPLLLGNIGEFGSGLIPRRCLDMETIKDAKKASTGVGAFRVRHCSGEWSTVEFKSYDQGRQAFEGTARSIWCDEEPPEDVYSECLLRTMTGDNIMMLTFTPLRGASAVVLSFSRDGIFDEGEIAPGRHVTTCTWDDVPHLDETAKQELLSSIPRYQRLARSRGVPTLGSGAIYTAGEDAISVPNFAIPDYWPRAYGLDVGWNRTAAIWAAEDRDSGVWYLYSEHYEGEAHPSVHAQSIRGRGDWIPGVIDPAGRGRTQDDGQQLLQLYLDNGLDLEPANNAVEAALFEIDEALHRGQIKVFSTLTNFFREYRSYARDERGKIIKKNDHLLDAFRYLWNSGRTRARTRPVNKLQGPGLVPTQRRKF